ncbi:MAG: hypothetical protein LBR98_07620 [Syntrophomonadaceae bacterium]|jgi:hypothetical protein|nr:hypothetical protein [Syntrophomonadaceae bacterium]
MFMSNVTTDAPVMKIKTEKYQAVPIKNLAGKARLVITTARRSSVEARLLCGICGTRGRREDFCLCDFCGSMLCGSCFDKHRSKKPLPPSEDFQPDGSGLFPSAHETRETPCDAQ